MKSANIRLFAYNFWRSATTPKSFYVLYFIFLVLAGYAIISGVQNHIIQSKIRQEHQSKARESWEANPDKHPHRMSHFGTFAFRTHPPLAMFDSGLESFTGNTVFLEAHQQNSVNFSEATFSTGTLRFGELSLALLLRLVLPLLLFFIGFSSVAADKQNGTLKILLSQGATWKELLLGKSIGLSVISLLFFAPILIVLPIALLLVADQAMSDFIWLRFGIIGFAYLVFLCIVSIITIVVSALSNTPKNALLRLLGIWLLLLVLLPKSAQALGNYWFPTPSKLAFQSAIEKEVIAQGDSHNPDDPHYQQLKDSILKVYKVNKVTDLPFNYSGFVMQKGEKVSAALYRKHHTKLVAIYKKQNNATWFSSFINPFSAIKLVSMTLSGTDFSSYIHFQKQAMNKLQMEYISPKKKSGSEGKKHVVNHEHWEEFEDFKHLPMSFGNSVSIALPALLSLILWTIVALVLLLITSKKAKSI